MLQYSKDSKSNSERSYFFFLLESFTKNVKLSSEHQNFIWLNFSSAHRSINIFKR